MIVLDTTTRKIQILVDATATTTESPVVASWEDLTTTTNLVGGSQIITTGATAVDAVAVPSASTQRVVKFMSVYNADTVAHSYTFRYNDNGTTRNLFVPLLSPGQTAIYDNGLWVVVPTYLSIDPGLCEGRLTLTTGVPVTTSDVTGATTIYFTPYKGNRLSLYTNSAWTLYAFSEKSVALGTLASATIPNDVFIYDNAGTLTLELVAWTSTTARATALVLQDGVLVKSGSTNKRYLGTFCPTATTTTEDSKTKRLLWNMYNRIKRHMSMIDTTDSWTYSTAAFRLQNNGAGSGTGKLEMVRGIDEDCATARVMGLCSSGVAQSPSVGIGLDSTTVNSAQIFAGGVADTTAVNKSCHAAYEGCPGLGYHYLAWLEYGQSATLTWYGDAGVTQLQSGIVGEVFA